MVVGDSYISRIYKEEAESYIFLECNYIESKNCENIPIASAIVKTTLEDLYNNLFKNYAKYGVIYSRIRQEIHNHNDVKEPHQMNFPKKKRKSRKRKVKQKVKN